MSHSQHQIKVNPTAIRPPSAGRTDPDLSTPTLTHRSQPSEVWGPLPVCPSLLAVFANQTQSLYAVAREIRTPPFPGSYSVCRIRLSLPQCQIQPPPAGQSRAKYGAPFCMHITIVRSTDL